ncbi:hypothetical protein KEJ40_01250 [Candidatus Bathyarchaeota archaeon]|nr:hypothetical protein [Candidatus Bathyarchaeota archaeon]
MDRFKSKTSVERMALIAISASLYAAAIAVTSPIPTPWGIGHFRPGVIVPALFALISTPMVAGMGAAIGTFIGSFILSLFGLSNPVLSLVSGVPGNFIAFYLLSFLSYRYRSLAAFIASSLISLFIGNIIAASGVLLYYSTVTPLWLSWTIEAKLSVIIGLTLFWVTTMLPFVVTLTPVIAGALNPIISNLNSSMLRRVEFTKIGSGSRTIYSSLIVALILILVYITATLTPIGDILFAKVIKPEYTPWVKTLILISGLVTLVFGIAVSVMLKIESKINSSSIRTYTDS